MLVSAANHPQATVRYDACPGYIYPITVSGHTFWPVLDLCVATGIPVRSVPLRGPRTESNPTITPAARAIAETPPFATPSNELPAQLSRLT
ncbi:hypothetical protein Stube_16920 [Streptomyces tubercidicus]|uniref:Uncharacterized protein n=1 Tax=Streptomyces tubercidicus TaxID=47759 RepID=A0A640UMV0_9ACTN|nr:hypothetical protein Stube_16920 [Streptomyces tubercidicus]